MNLDSIKAKLEALKSQGQNNSNSDLFWKPKAGDGNTQAEYTIRILPNFAIDANAKPFMPLYFYYDFGKTMLSPFTFDEPDPVVEYTNALKLQKGSKEEVSMNWKIARKLEPKSRIFVPVLVRGQEHEGVKFWGFGVTIYRALDELFDDPDWGNLSDLEEGKDIKVVFKPAQSSAAYPETTVVPKPKSTPAATDAATLEKIKTMPNVCTLFNKPSYDELKTALKTYLSGKQGEETQPATSAPNTSTNSNDSFDTSNFKPPTANQETSTPKVDVSDIEAAFDELINSK